jgi:hypothetical protein
MSQSYQKVGRSSSKRPFLASSVYERCERGYPSARVCGTKKVDKLFMQLDSERRTAKPPAITGWLMQLSSLPRLLLDRVAYIARTQVSGLVPPEPSPR